MRPLSPHRYLIDPETGCWLWQRATTQGYGQLSIDGKLHYAHRWYYEQERGPIPDGLQIDHLCCNKLCVNPEHLEPVTQIENIWRSAKLTPDEARALRDSDEPTKVLAERYGLTVRHVNAVRSGHAWRGLGS